MASALFLLLPQRENVEALSTISQPHAPGALPSRVENVSGFLLPGDAMAACFLEFTAQPEDCPRRQKGWTAKVDQKRKEQSSAARAAVQA